MTAYEDAKEIARKLVDTERTRKNAQTELKALKEELLAIYEDNNIDKIFEFTDGIVMLEHVVNYKIADGMKEATEVKSKKPEELSEDFIEEFFIPDIKLSKKAKKAILEDNQDLLSVLVPEEKDKVKIVVE